MWSIVHESWSAVFLLYASIVCVGQCARLSSIIHECIVTSRVESLFCGSIMRPASNKKWTENMQFSCLTIHKISLMAACVSFCLCRDEPAAALSRTTNILESSHRDATSFREVVTVSTAQSERGFARASKKFTGVRKYSILFEHPVHFLILLMNH